MHLSFQNILVPVDFTENTYSALKNVLAIIDQTDTQIHLLHIQKEFSTVSTTHLNGAYVVKSMPDNYSFQMAKERLSQIEKNIRELSPWVKVSMLIISKNSVQLGIIETARKIQPDLIVIGKQHGHKWLTFLNAVNSSFIARETKCAVLNVSSGKVPNKIKSVVLPMGCSTPVSKIELLPAITHKQKPTIHLLTTLSNAPKASNSSVFIDTYRSITQVLRYPVYHKILSGRNTVKSILKYSLNISADILVVNSFNETVLSPIFGTQITDFVNPGLNILITAHPQ